MKQPATILFFFSVPRRIQIIKTRKLKQFFFWTKIEKKARAFFQFLAKKFLFEFSVLYDWNSSRDTKKE